MSRNIVLCCDGTANEFASDRTNVVKLYYALVQDPAKQIVSYHPGLGTMEAPGALLGFTKTITKWAGLAFGAGLERDIGDAYVFLMNNFEKGDRVYMFGFSRGAYTVRAVASLLKMYGLLPKGSEPFVPYAVRMLHAVNSAKEKSDRDASFDLASEFRETFDRAGKCRPHFVGVWDTVSSVGWVENQLRLPYSASNPEIAHGRHAIALDERRAFFRSNLWWPARTLEETGPKDMKQIWFPGVHCDVGGGYPECQSALSKVPLKWMMDEVAGLQLVFDEERRATVLGDRGGKYVKPDGTAPAHESLAGWWWPAEFLLKRHYDRDSGIEGRKMNLGRKRTIPPAPSIHRSAYERGKEYASKLPKDAVIVDG
ncbi:MULTISPECIES: DUF2235 domain-containing protein [unclassified Bradyrhizobium]|uniref:T6SS phospholipase effector Tle1-like catalytic domain-containing protein n=1 Tax=unclassified Bradyrhizobium TaxID=2631580 RepID=UPI001FFBDA0D|nr:MULTISPECIES: DUF2235 domain-containing protein [unclassified Bradyrhizobium]MCK1270821.1 DUF2235 domain-containing protein [Bradyrhizobium sp. 84]MCK1372128.1 DUF2235 domain-containing protein [Bradyrhizobium sp. 49]MCK1430671.1 DUF2235 domain-containing protein [Bradyrhizobium sp. 87]